MKGNKILYAGIAILVLGIGFAIGTYAYYQTTITGTASGTVLAWNCAMSESGTPLAANFTMALGGLHPGSSGSKTITVTSSMAADVVLTFTGFTNMGSGSNHPYLNIYKDSAHATVIGNNGVIEDEVAAGGSKDISFYYYWPYGSGSGEQGVESYVSSAPSVTLTIECKQKEA